MLGDKKNVKKEKIRVVPKGKTVAENGGLNEKEKLDYTAGR